MKKCFSTPTFKNADSGGSKIAATIKISFFKLARPYGYYCEASLCVESASVNNELYQLCLAEVSEPRCSPGIDLGGDASPGGLKKFSDLLRFKLSTGKGLIA